MPGPLSNYFMKNYSYVAASDATFVSNPYKSKVFESMILNNLQKNLISTHELAAIMENRHCASCESNGGGAVIGIIKNDPAVPGDIDTEKTAKMIIDAAAEAGIDPITLACIAKQETHFNQNVPSRNGSGMVQLTTISLKDMYMRPQIYDDTLKSVIKKYGSLDKVFEAKRKNPSLNIGKFGELLMEANEIAIKNAKKVKNGTATAEEKKLTQPHLVLRKMIREDAATNLRVGAYLYKSKLKQARGNEKLALALYNGSPIKEKYSEEVLDNIKGVRSSVKFDNMA